MGVIQNPLVGMQGDEMMTRFVGVLERRVILLTAQELRFRALLESLTGEPWDDQYADLDQAELDGLVEDSLVKSLGITKMEAAQMVRVNRRKANSRNDPAITESAGVVAELPSNGRIEVPAKTD